MTIGLAAWGASRGRWFPAFVTAQMLGAIVGQLAIVVTHKRYYCQTKALEDILGTFSTINSTGSRAKVLRPSSSAPSSWRLPRW